MTTIEPTKGEGEYGVKFNEPTTGEIVRALRNCADATAKKKPCTPECYYFNRTECCAGSLYDNAADRLESQEQTIAALTARAEQAEKERDAAVYALSVYEDALLDECDKSYQRGCMDGFRSKEEMDDED